MTIGERLRDERKRVGANQTVMAEQCGVTKNTQLAYEKGERNPDAAYLVSAAALGIDVLYVLTGTRAPTSADALNKDEDALLANYRQLDEKGRATVQDVTQALAKAALLTR